VLTTLLTLLLPDCDHLHLSTIETDPNQVTLILSITDAHPACPDCGTSALRIHSHYTRTLADLPWAARAVRLRLQVARFFCDAPSCPRTTFALRVPTIALPRARRTTRLAAAQQELGLVLGGEAGAKLAHTQGMASSPDTLLRLVRRHAAPAGPTPKVLGIDDWVRPVPSKQAVAWG
jgi:zinc-finger of transposase IS204/IS1001/IS1096/IS1165